MQNNSNTTCFLLSPLSRPWFSCMRLIYHNRRYCFMNSCVAVLQFTGPRNGVWRTFSTVQYKNCGGSRRTVVKFSPDYSSAVKSKDAISAICSSIMLFKGETTITHFFSDRNCSFAMAKTVNIRLFPNPVGKIAMTSRPASSSFTAVSCSLLRIIFSFSRLTLRRSSALSMVDSADSAIIFRNSLPSTPLGNMRKIMRRIIYYDWHMYSPRPISFPAHWCAGYSKYRGFLAASISNASSPLLFLDRSSAAKTLITQYRQLRRLRAVVPYVITKFSRMDSLLKFVTHGALMRASRAREPSY